MLNKYNFKSIFKNEINNFILYKRSLGLDYEKEISRLNYMDNILYNLKLKNKRITKDIFVELTKRYSIPSLFMKFLRISTALFINNSCKFYQMPAELGVNGF